MSKLADNDYRHRLVVGCIRVDRCLSQAVVELEEACTWLYEDGGRDDMADILKNAMEEIKRVKDDL